MGTKIAAPSANSNDARHAHLCGAATLQSHGLLHIPQLGAHQPIDGPEDRVDVHGPDPPPLHNCRSWLLDACCRHLRKPCRTTGTFDPTSLTPLRAGRSILRTAAAARLTPTICVSRLPIHVSPCASAAPGTQRAAVAIQKQNSEEAHRHLWKRDEYAAEEVPTGIHYGTTHTGDL